jgi:tetratricopeptide (TPR) repeat protein
MYSIQFWKSWPVVNQRIFWVFVVEGALALVFLWTSNFYSPAPVLIPRTFQQLESVEFSSRSFPLAIFNLSIPAEVYLIFERTIGAPLRPNLSAPVFFVGVMVFSMIGLLSVITTLRRFWFYLGMGSFILLLVSLRLESVKIFGFSNSLPTAVVIALLGGPAYYFQYLNRTSSFTRRLFIFAGIYLVVGAVIFRFSQVQHPFLLISANSLIACTLLTFIFIFTVAHEILASLIFAVSQGTRQKRSLRHFLTISTIYLINLGLLYADRKHFLHWNFPVSLFLFITFSGILGLWGFRQREPQYEGIIEANPFGVFLYLSLAAVAFSTIGYFLATANDPVIQLAQDAILYSHMGYGLIFLVYVISNFAPMLAGNLQVYRVLYKPTNMPYFTFRLAGLIATFAFFAYSNWKVSLDQIYAGYYNTQGDLHVSEDTTRLAEGYYRRSLFYALRNYHAHYALAQIDESRGESEKEKKEYQTLVDSRPLDLAYLNLSTLFENTNSSLESEHVLKQGLHDFPGNGLLENELGIVYSQLNEKDSAFVMVNSATSSSIATEAKTNLMGLNAKFKLTFPADSMLMVLGPENPGVKSNGLALACMQGNPMPIRPDPGTDSVLSVYSIIALHNYLLSNENQPDTSLISKTIRLGRKNSNPYFKDFLLYSSAYSLYANGQVDEAIKLLRELAFLGQEEKYYNVLGLWSLEQNVPHNAVSYFDEALKRDYQPSFFNKSIGLTESGNFREAQTAWDSLLHSPDIAVQRTAKKMTSALNATPDQALHLSDEEKYLYTRYRMTIYDDSAFQKILSTIADPELKVRSIIDRCKKLDEADEPDLAVEALSYLKGISITHKDLLQEIAHLNLLFFARQKKWQVVEQQMNSGITFNRNYKLEKIYLDALLDVQAGRRKEARRKFTWLIHANAYFEDAIVAGVEFLSQSNPDTLTIYAALADAIELNPHSIKLLKVYTVLSARLEFEDIAQESLEKLKTLMSPSSFLRFVQENPAIFEVARN